MSKLQIKGFTKGIKDFVADFREFSRAWYRFLFVRIFRWVRHFERGKSAVAEKLYEGRGKFARPFVHSGMGGLAVLGILLAPIIGSSFSNRSFAQVSAPSAVLSSATEAEQTSTFISDKPQAEVRDYTVQKGDTISGLAQKFGLSVDTIKWANNLEENMGIKPGQVIKIPPVTGIVHKVKKGDTVYSVAKYYQTDAQGIVDYPFNTFTSDETFELAVGQVLIVPDGVMPKAAKVYIAKDTPNAGTVVASGIFVWPTSGKISQRFSWYHRAVDIANAVGTPILAADAGKVIVAGWPDNVGYGNRVMIDHGNGYVTLYAHMSKVLVDVGQTVQRGSTIGLMGSTGRSTGPHCHFEIRASGKTQDPLAYLK